MSGGFSVVIPTWNGRELLREYLPAVLAAAQGSEIVVSDDGSSDATAAWLAEAHPAIRCVRSQRNRGFAPAANAGVQAATAPIVVLLNNDVAPAADCFAHLVPWFDDPAIFGVTLRAFDLPQKTFATGGKLGRFRRGFWETWRNYEASADGRGASFMLVGGFCAFRREVFLELGGFDPIFAPYYSEDLDLSYRARKRGWRLGYEPRARLWHAPSSSVRRHSTPFRRAAVIERNRLLFHWRNLDAGRLAAHLLWAHLLLLQNLLRGNFAYPAGYLQAVRRVAAVRGFRRAEAGAWHLRDQELELAEPTLLPAPASLEQEPL